jgi:hypothetical protein
LDSCCPTHESYQWSWPKTIPDPRFFNWFFAVPGLARTHHHWKTTRRTCHRNDMSRIRHALDLFIAPLCSRPKEAGSCGVPFVPRGRPRHPREESNQFKRNGSDVKTDLKAYCCLAVFYLACTPFVFAQAPAVSPGGTVVAAGLRHGFGLPR